MHDRDRQTNGAACPNHPDGTLADGVRITGENQPLPAIELNGKIIGNVDWVSYPDGSTVGWCAVPATEPADGTDPAVTGACCAVGAINGLLTNLGLVKATV